MNKRWGVTLTISIIVAVGVVFVCWRLAQPKSAVNYGSPLGAAISARNAIQSYVAATARTPFEGAGLTNLLDYGLDEKAIPMLSLLTTSSMPLHPSTVVVISRSVSPRPEDHYSAYIVLHSGAIAQLPESEATLGSRCPDDAKPVFSERVKP